MRLRIKVILSVIVIIGALTAVIFYIFSANLTEDFRKLEEDKAYENISRAYDTLASRIDDLSVKLSDWAQWDDTYDFVQDRNEEYVDVNLQEEALTLLQINLIIITDESGDIIFKKHVNREGEEKPFPERLEQYFPSKKALPEEENSAPEGYEGILIIPAGPVIIVSRGVTSSDGTAPLKGEIAFGYFFDETAVEQLSNLTYLKISYSPYGADNLDRAFDAPCQALSKEHPFFVETPQNQEKISAYALINDVFGDPVLILRAEMNRNTYQQGLKAIAFFKKSILFAGIAIILVILILFEYLVIRRLSRLSANINKINVDKGQLAIEVISGKDEVSRLAVEINKMLEKVDMAETRKKELEKLRTADTEKIQKQNQHSEKTNKAILNILEDISNSEQDLQRKTIELKKASLLVEEQKKRAEGILRFLQSIGEGVFATDLNCSLIFVNLTAVKMISRVESDPLIGKEYSDNFLFMSGKGDGKKKIDPVREVLKNPQVYVLPNDCYLNVQSENIPISGSFAPITEKGKILGAVGVFQDITECHKIEKEKDNFMSITAHQLRTPLSGIRWMLESLLDGDAGKLSREAKDYLKQISENNQRLVTVVNDLLDVSRINMGKNKEASIPVDICKILQEAVETLKGLANERKVEIFYEKTPSLKSKIKASPKHLFQALENLISNAIRYTPGGGKVKVVADKKDGKVLVSIIDTGIGIPKKDQDKIFSKFFRASNAVLKEADGSGLGLNVVKLFIEENGGKVWFKSEEGKGSTFYVALPFWEATESPHP